MFLEPNKIQEIGREENKAYSERKIVVKAEISSHEETVFLFVLFCF